MSLERKFNELASVYFRETEYAGSTPVFFYYEKINYLKSRLKTKDEEPRNILHFLLIPSVIGDNKKPYYNILKETLKDKSQIRYDFLQLYDGVYSGINIPSYYTNKIKDYNEYNIKLAEFTRYYLDILNDKGYEINIKEEIKEFRKSKDYINIIDEYYKYLLTNIYNKIQNKSKDLEKSKDSLAEKISKRQHVNNNTLNLDNNIRHFLLSLISELERKELFNLLFFKPFYEKSTNLTNRSSFWDISSDPSMNIESLYENPLSEESKLSNIFFWFLLILTILILISGIGIYIYLLTNSLPKYKFITSIVLLSVLILVIIICVLIAFYSSKISLIILLIFGILFTTTAIVFLFI